MKITQRTKEEGRKDLATASTLAHVMLVTCLLLLGSLLFCKSGTNNQRCYRERGSIFVTRERKYSL